MKRMILAFALLTSPAFAADPPKPPPTCGKTAEECQEKVDKQAGELKSYSGLLAEANDRLAAALNR